MELTREVFGPGYASLYSSLYHDKNYESECDFVEAAFRKCGENVHTILDLGCGSGGHAIPLARRGYSVVGVDRSPEMLQVAKQRAAEAGVHVEWRLGDLTNIRLHREFDAVLSMFAVMSYQVANRDLAAACSSASAHLRRGGVFVFDAWHGMAVLKDRPTERTREVKQGSQRILRFTKPSLNVQEHAVDTQFTVWLLEGDRLVREVTETHRMRFFFEKELSYYLEVAGFAGADFVPFMNLERTLTDADWQLAAIARKPMGGA